MIGGIEDVPDDFQEYAVTLDNVSKIYAGDGGDDCALNDLSLGVRRGRFCVVMGAARSGKTTLLECMAGTVRPSSGTVRWGAEEVGAIGLLGADDELPDEGTVHDFVSKGKSGTAFSDRELQNAFRVVRLWARRRRVRDLSPIQLKKARVARVLAASPRLVLVDEPTGRNWEEDARVLGDIMRKAVRTLKVTAVMATRDPVAASRADSVVFLRDGCLVDAIANASADEIKDCMKSINAR
ncbi:ATP-binding cassette domain-containing protein [Streptomyces sp. NPDC048637]|uniref:ATP-binding cassette domain-containing protein n=1 Tax=Streptomyces sp. NPDC048637 TaxID=3155636 RepID=UPI0034290158